MPAPIRVELLPHSSQWATEAKTECARLLDAFPDNLVAVHHIGSTAIPGIHAKPILDLLLECHSLVAIDEAESQFLNLGYRGWGEYGIQGRRYFTFDEPLTHKRRIQLHCFQLENAEIKRHLAFRDYLRANRSKAQEYDREKQRCRKLHPDDSHAYSNAKAEWITAHTIEALAWFQRDQRTWRVTSGFEASPAPGEL